jgi:diphthamide biosynthesis protein 7
MQVLKDCFEAGVTCASHHPRREHLVACGSYDETVALFDVRYLSQKPICHSSKLDGGIWRIKWHPVSDDRLLVAAMHGGCRVLRLTGWDGDVVSGDTANAGIEVTKKFTQHESMAYGADWLVCKHPTQSGYFEAAASCSFYDRSVYLWDTVF